MNIIDNVSPAGKKFTQEELLQRTMVQVSGAAERARLAERTHLCGVIAHRPVPAFVEQRPQQEDTMLLEI